MCDAAARPGGRLSYAPLDIRPYDLPPVRGTGTLMKLTLKDRWNGFRMRMQVRLRPYLPPPYPGMRLTAKRLANFYLVQYQHRRGHTRLRGAPLILTVEATNVCNLGCPYCFTGAGERG